MPQAEERNGPECLNVPLDRRRTAERDEPVLGTVPAAGWSENEMPRQQRRAGAAMPAQESVKECVPHDRPAEKMVFFPKNGYLCMLSLRARATEAQPAKAERPQNDKTETTWT